MSKQGKVNPDHYKLAGTLTPDDQARERVKQRQSISRAGGRPRGAGAAAPNTPQKPVSGKGRSKKS